MSDNYLDLHNIELTGQPYQAQFISISPSSLPAECILPPDGTVPSPPSIFSPPPLACVVNIDTPLIPLPYVCTPSFGGTVAVLDCIGNPLPSSGTGTNNITLSPVPGTDCEYELGGSIEVCIPDVCIPDVDGSITVSTCPDGIATVTGGDSILIQPKPGTECGFELVGNVEICVPPICIPTVGGSVTIDSCPGSIATITGGNSIQVVADPNSECGFKLEGDVQICVPPICVPTVGGGVTIDSCPDSIATITGGDSIQIVPDPNSECGFKLEGDVQICVPPICVPTVSGGVTVTACPDGVVTVQGGDSIQIVPDPNTECGFKLEGDVQICVPPVCIPTVTGGDITITDCDGNPISDGDGGTSGGTIGITPVAGTECDYSIGGDIKICLPCIPQITVDIEVTSTSPTPKFYQLTQTPKIDVDRSDPCNPVITGGLVLQGPCVPAPGTITITPTPPVDDRHYAVTQALSMSKDDDCKFNIDGTIAVTGPCIPQIQPISISYSTHAVATGSGPAITMSHPMFTIDYEELGCNYRFNPGDGTNPLDVGINCIPEYTGDPLSVGVSLPNIAPGGINPPTGFLALSITPSVTGTGCNRQIQVAVAVDDNGGGAYLSGGGQPEYVCDAGCADDPANAITELSVDILSPNEINFNGTDASGCDSCCENDFSYWNGDCGDELQVGDSDGDYKITTSASGSASIHLLDLQSGTDISLSTEGSDGGANINLLQQGFPAGNNPSISITTGGGGAPTIIVDDGAGTLVTIEAGGDGGSPSITIEDGNSGSSVSIDTADIAGSGAPPGTSLSISPLTVCVDGEMKQVLFLCSGPY